MAIGRRKNKFTSLLDDATVRIRKYRTCEVQFDRHHIVLTRENIADFAEAIQTLAEHLDDTTEGEGVYPEQPAAS